MIIDESIDKLREECGVVGIFNHPESANLAYLGLHALQHRGQEAFGIVSCDDQSGFHTHKTFGLVSDGIDKSKLELLKGSSSIGHNRYSTHGSKYRIENIQPFVFNTHTGPLAICHNGNLTNADTLKVELERQGAIFHSTSDTEIFMHLLARTPYGDPKTRIMDVTGRVKGAYSLVVMTPDSLIGVRDPYGYRPLVMGKKDGATVLASESCALDLIGAEFVREIKPGEICQIRKNGVESVYIERKAPENFCSFEPIYFSRPDSRMNDVDVYAYRSKIGEQLATESPSPDADLVIAIPDSGVAMAMGYAKAAKLPYDVGLVRNHYVGRTFIEPTQAIRDFGVRLKLNPRSTVLRGKSVVVVDDSIVRGTTSIKIVRMLRNAGAEKIHVRIGSPPITHSCYFGVDTPNRQNLVAAQKQVSEIRDMLGADSLAFLSVEGLKKALGHDRGYCFGCFSGKYAEDIGTKIAEQPTDGSGPGLRA